MLQTGSGGRAASCRAFHMYMDAMGAAQVSKDNVSDTPCFVPGWKVGETQYNSQPKTTHPKQTFPTPFPVQMQILL